MKAYSVDLRKRVLADCDAGLGTKAVAEKYSVSPAIVRRWKQRRRENGELGPRRSGGRRPRQVDRAAVAAAARAQPDATLRELRDALGLDVSIQTIWRVLRELQFSFKKKSCTPPSKTGPTSRRRERTGEPGKSGSIRVGSSSSTKPGRKRT